MQYKTKRNKACVSKTRTVGVVFFSVFFPFHHAGTMQKVIVVNKIIVMMLSDNLTCKHELQTLWLLNYLCANFLSYATAAELQINQTTTTHSALSGACVTLYLKQISGKYNMLKIPAGKRLNNWLFTEHGCLVSDYQRKWDGALKLVRCTSLQQARVTSLR